MPYAQRTKVPVDRSKAEIESLVMTKGAEVFFSGNKDGRAFVVFEIENRRMRFSIPLPPSGNKARDEQAVRGGWRQLLLSIKAKFTSVETGIETLEEAFLAHIVVAGGETVYERMSPEFDAAMHTGRLPPLLPAGKQ